MFSKSVQVKNVTMYHCFFFPVHHLDLGTMQKEFENSGKLPGSRGSFTCDDLFTLLINIFSHAADSDWLTDDVEKLADLSLNFILNLFDK